jgi:hypothetical protein
MDAKTNDKIFEPAFVVTSEKWSREAVVVSWDEEWFPEEWVTERMDCIRGEDEIGDTPINYDDVKQEMMDEFGSDNESVDEYWPDHGILRTDEGHYYRYDTENGSFATYIGTFKSLDECKEFCEI